jgi:hypothetical protein
MGWLKSKRWVKDWLPPAVLALYRRWRKEDVSYEWVSYTGNYSSWQDALANSTGYDSDLILEKVSTALLKVKSGEAVYERDSGEGANFLKRISCSSFSPYKSAWE